MSSIIRNKCVCTWSLDKSILPELFFIIFEEKKTFEITTCTSYKNERFRSDFLWKEIGFRQMYAPLRCGLLGYARRALALHDRVTSARRLRKHRNVFCNSGLTLVDSSFIRVNEAFYLLLSVNLRRQQRLTIMRVIA